MALKLIHSDAVVRDLFAYSLTILQSTSWCANVKQANNTCINLCRNGMQHVAVMDMADSDNEVMTKDG